MDATLATMSDDDLRADVRDWLAANWRDKISDLQDYMATPAYRQWIGKVIAARWAVPRVSTPRSRFIHGRWADSAFSPKRAKRIGRVQAIWMKNR